MIPRGAPAKFTPHKGSWGDRYRIENPNKRYYSSCSTCKYYMEDKSCAKKGSFIPEIGYDFWKYCDDYEYVDYRCQSNQPHNNKNTHVFDKRVNRTVFLNPHMNDITIIARIGNLSKNHIRFEYGCKYLVHESYSAGNYVIDSKIQLKTNNFDELFSKNFKRIQFRRNQDNRFSVFICSEKYNRNTIDLNHSNIEIKEDNEFICLYCKISGNLSRCKLL